jgi:hypothetical protein
MKASIQFGQLVSTVMLLASASAFAAGAVADGGRTLNDGFGRGSALPTVSGKAVHSAGDVPGVQHVAGRGSQIPAGNKIGAVRGNGTDIGQFGRASGTMAASRVGGNTQTAGLGQ